MWENPAIPEQPVAPHTGPMFPDAEIPEGAVLKTEFTDEESEAIELDRR